MFLFQFQPPCAEYGSCFGCARRLADVARPDGRCYWPRSGEAGWVQETKTPPLGLYLGNVPQLWKVSDAMASLDGLPAAMSIMLVVEEEGSHGALVDR